MLAIKLKYPVDELSSTSSSTTNSIIKLKTTVAATKTEADQAASKSRSLKK